MVTPLYSFLKSRGTSFYAFPSSAEDINAQWQNQNYKMYFTKYVLLNLPKQQLDYATGTTNSQPVYWDFTNSTGVGQGFQSSNQNNPPANFGDQVVESLRNYVANQDITIRESRTNNTDYYFDPNATETTAEKVFFKWCKKLGLIDFEPALGGAIQYFDNLSEFARNNVNDDSYFPEYLWQERQVISWDATTWDNASSPYVGNIQCTFAGTTNFVAGDIVQITSVTASELMTAFGTDTVSLTVLATIPVLPSGQIVVFDFMPSVPLFGTPVVDSTAQATLVYNRLIQYVGEVNGVSNVNLANLSYTEVYANVPSHTGVTPDVLFRTMVDDNYKPNMVFPIIPNQYQPEIVGAELFNSPIVSNPQDYPGSYFGQFDINDFTYDVANGDSLRRSGDYFGVDGDINAPVVNGKTIDGITLDFDISHYAKMNIPNRAITNFDQFDALEVDNQPPKDFKFNAILWYYVMEDPSGTQSTNLYGVSFLDNPDNNPVESEVGIAFPRFEKYVSNGNQDGTAYQFSINLNFGVNNDNPIEAYNPEAINSMFSMNLFNDAMAKLSSINNTFLLMLADQQDLVTQVNNLQSIIYNQTDLNTINNRINNLNQLLNLYQTTQIVSSDTIAVTMSNQTSPPTIQLTAIDPSYVQLNSVNTVDMYNVNGIVPYNITVPVNKNFLVYVSNNDELSFTIPNNNHLTIVLNQDLYYKQKVDFIITGSDLSSENKKLDIYMMTEADNTTTVPVETLLISDIDFPIFFNKNTQQPNSAKTWSKFNFDIDFSQPITLKSNGILALSIDTRYDIFLNSIKPGDTLVLNNLFIGTTSVFNFSGEYLVDSISPTQSQMNLNISSNTTFVNYGASQSLPMDLHNSTSTLLANLPFISLNKGYKVSITRINPNLVPLAQRYNIEITDL